MTSTTQKNAGDTPTTKEPAAYRGPDRREKADRRSGEERRSTSPPPEILEQRCGEDRRGGAERRNPLRNALYRAGNDAYDARYKLAYEVVPLLALCEFAARAGHSLKAFEFWSQRDKALADRLERWAPDWRVAIDDETTELHIGRCIGMVKNIAANLADELDGISEQAYAACELEQDAATHSARVGQEAGR